MTRRLTSIWRDLAYAARYGHQPLSELRAMLRTDFQSFCAGITGIVAEENHRPESPDDEE